MAQSELISIPGRQLLLAGTLGELSSLLKREIGWCADTNTLYYKAENGELIPVRGVTDDLLQQIEAASVQTDWEQDDASKLDYLKNKPIPITQADIGALFI